MNIKSKAKKANTYFVKTNTIATINSILPFIIIAAGFYYMVKYRDYKEGR